MDLDRIFTPGVVFCIIIAAIISLNWYGKLNHIVYTEVVHEVSLEDKEIDLIEDNNGFKGKNVIKSERKNYRYWNEITTNYKKTRTAIPFVYDKVILSKSETKYRQEK